MTTHEIPSEERITILGRSTPLPGATSALLLLLAINLFNFLDRQILAAVEPEIRRDLLGGVPQAGAWSGALNFAFLVTYMLIAPLFGWMADRMSRWLLVGIGVTIWSLASGASGLDWAVLIGVNLSIAYWLLFFTRCLVGVGEAAYGPVAPTMLSDLYPVSQRGRILSWFYLAIPIGGALGYTFGDIMVRYDPAHGWRWAFYLVVPPGLLLGVWCFIMREPPRGRAEMAEPVAIRKPTLQDYLDLFKIPSYLLNMIGMTCMMFAMGGLAFWMAEFLTQHQAEPVLGLGPRSFFGLLTALAGLLATLAGGAAGDWMRRYHSGSYFLVSGASMMLGFPMVLLAIWVPFPAAWFFIFLAVFSLFFNTAPTNAINANVTHPSVRATAFALNILFTHLFGDAISPAVIGLVMSWASLDLGFVVVSVLMLIGSGFWIWGAFYLQRDTDLAPTRLRQS
jgi:MFS family permease